MSVMAILQDVDKCVRCGGCVIACQREWKLKLFDDIEDVKPARSVVSSRKRLAIKSQRRADMGPFVRFTCWHCPDPPCAASCKLGAIKKDENGAVSVDPALCDPGSCWPNKPAGAPYPCQNACQRGGYPKVGVAYESGPYAGDVKMNKCTLCSGRAGSDAQITALGQDPALGLQTRATLAEIAAVPEKKHEPACVSSCPAKAMKWDTRANILAYLNDAANGYIGADGSKNWVGNGSLFWVSRSRRFIPPKADPFIEDHIAPMASSMLSSGRMLLPTLVVGGLAALSARRTRNEEAEATTAEEV